MTLALIFALGILNVAANKAVIESGSPLLESLPPAFREKGGRVSIALEVGLLLAALLFASSGFPAAGWLYALYSLGTLTAAWAILTRRI